MDTLWGYIFGDPFLFSEGEGFLFQPPFFACRPASFQHASREPRIPQGGIFIGRRGHFSCDCYGIFTYFRPFSGNFPESPLWRGGGMIICD